MGIYDFFYNDVNCFYNVKPMVKDNKLYFSKHNLNSSISLENNILPIKTFYYKYPDNFVVLNEQYSKLYIIKDKALYKVLDIKDATNDIFLENIYNANGDRLKIKTVDDLNNFIIDNEYKNKKEAKLYKKYNPSSKNIIIAFKLINCDSSNSYNIVDILEDGDYAEFNELLKDLGLRFSLDINTPAKSKSIIQNISLDESRSSRIINFIKEKAYELLYRFNGRIDEEKEELSIHLNHLSQEFKTKWFYEKKCIQEMTFGYFIASINAINNDDMDDFNRELLREKIFIELSNYIYHNDGIVDKYIDWINPNIQELKIINSIINQIYKN